MTKMLIVEDDIYLLSLYKEVFQREGFQVETAEDGQQGIDKAKEFVPEVVLLDLMLPYFDGFAVLESIKSDSETKEAKVIVATNLDSAKQREKAEKLGAAHFLVKVGDTPGNIIEEVKKLLKD